MGGSASPIPTAASDKSGSGVSVSVSVDIAVEDLLILTATEMVGVRGWWQDFVVLPRRQAVSSRGVFLDHGDEDEVGVDVYIYHTTDGAVIKEIHSTVVVLLV